jgi:hypothetical protein
MGQSAVRLCRENAPSAEPVSRNFDVTKPARSVQFWILLICSAAASLIVFQIYAPAVRAPFFFDDYVLPFTMQSYRVRPLTNG